MSARKTTAARQTVRVSGGAAGRGVTGGHPRAGPSLPPPPRSMRRPLAMGRADGGPTCSERGRKSCAWAILRVGETQGRVRRGWLGREAAPLGGGCRGYPVCAWLTARQAAMKRGCVCVCFTQAGAPDFDPGGGAPAGGRRGSRPRPLGAGRGAVPLRRKSRPRHCVQYTQRRGDRSPTRTH